MSQYPQPQRLADVLPPQKLPGEGELAPMFFEEKSSSKNIVSDLKSAKKIKYRLRISRVHFIVFIFSFIVLAGFVVARVSFFEDRISWAMENGKKIMQSGSPLQIFADSEMGINNDSALLFSENSSTLSFGSLLRQANFSDAWKIFTHGGEALDRFQKIFENYQRLSEEISKFINVVPGVFFDSSSSPLPYLYRIQSEIVDLNKNNDDLSSSLVSVKDALPLDFSDYAVAGSNLDRLSDIISSSIRWLESPHNVLVLFQNSSEMRPTGGFIGSYASLYVASGTIQKTEVYDISEADRQFSESIVPPRPLQHIVKNWRTADANWYFDFPSSAKQILSFLKKSDMYKASGSGADVSFDTVVAFSPRVLEDLISITGPIELKDRGLTLTSENFLKNIQGEIVAERIRSDNNPKEILKEVVEVIQERLQNMPVEDRPLLFETAIDWIRYKDVQIYGSDQNLQNIIRFVGVDGAVVSSSLLSDTDYLAIVDSTIGGEKTNHIVERNINFRVQIQTDGKIYHELEITRQHNGDRESARWYKVPNENYARVLIPPGSQLLGSSGFSKKSPSNRKYGSDYANDSMLVIYENSFKDILGKPNVQSFEESGKMGIAGWTTTESGEKTKTILSYENRLSQPLADGVSYSFIFEKQAGTEGRYNFEIDAPVGYHFKENNLPIFEYKTEDIPGRVVIDLTLEKV